MESKLVQSKYFRFSLVLIWMAIIFAFSHHANSGRVTEEYLGVINVPIRKLGHLSEYAILFALLRWAFDSINYGAKSFAAILIAVAYALTDEWHQSFVPGRSASAHDCLIDTIGVLLGTTTYILTLNLINMRASENSDNTSESP